MKKLASVAAAVGITALIANPASAALTTALPDGESLWVMGVGSPLAGHIRELDPSTGTLTGVFLDATVTSQRWNVGADFDPVTNSIFWIKDFGLAEQSIVRLDLDTDAETVFSAEPDNFDIRGIDVTDGVLRFLGRSTSGVAAGNDFIGVLTLDEANETATAGDIQDLGATVLPSALAINPTDGQTYLLTYDCDLYSVAESTKTPVIDGAGMQALGVNSDCVALDFDSNGRAWMTHNSTSNTVSFIPTELETTLEISDWEPASEPEYGEALFVHGAGASVDDGEDSGGDNLASTGTDSYLIILCGFSLVAAGLIAVRLRRRV